jgi:hypothetical protein
MKASTTALALILMACAPPPRTEAPYLSAAQRAALGDSLQHFAERMFELARARDLEGTLGLYGRRESFVHIDDGRPIEWPTLEAGMRRTFAQLPRNDIRWVEPPRIIVLGRDAAVVVGLHRFGGGAGVPAHDGMWTGVLERIGGAWKIVHSHSTDAPRP